MNVASLLLLAAAPPGAAVRLSLPTRHIPAALSWPRVAQASIRAAEDDTASLGLTPELEKVVKSFKMVPDQKLRYQQLLFLAKKLAPMDAALAVELNKVQGCLSTVYVVGSMQPDGTIDYVGESDSQLTKGIAALLINGLSNCTNEQIQAVDPKFIHVAGLAQSLTPGRNNGFINMLKMMKAQAEALAAAKGADAEQHKAVSEQSSAAEHTSARAGSAATPRAGGGRMAALVDTTTSHLGDTCSHLGPVGQRMTHTLVLEFFPVQLELVDESSQHAGHAGAKGLAGESHFALRIVSEAFEGASSLKRHQMVYAALQEEMKLIHALSIKTATPSEAS
jgi:sulfur transfer protein SufE/stress-induced morphogen